MGKFKMKIKINRKTIKTTVKAFSFGHEELLFLITPAT